jgi:hypothetical protein
MKSGAITRNRFGRIIVQAWALQNKFFQLFARNQFRDSVFGFLWHLYPRISVARFTNENPA